MKKFAVELRHVMVQDISMEIEAATAEEAKAKALAEVEETDALCAWDLAEDEIAVTGCMEVT